MWIGILYSERLVNHRALDFNLLTSVEAGAFDTLINLANLSVKQSSVAWLHSFFIPPNRSLSSNHISTLDRSLLQSNLKLTNMYDFFLLHKDEITFHISEWYRNLSNNELSAIDDAFFRNQPNVQKFAISFVVFLFRVTYIHLQYRSGLWLCQPNFVVCYECFCITASWLRNIYHTGTWAAISLPWLEMLHSRLSAIWAYCKLPFAMIKLPKWCLLHFA